MTKKVTMAKGVEEKESTTQFEEDNSHKSLLKQTNTGETVAKNKFKGDDDDAEKDETTDHERIPFVEKSPDMEGKEDESGSKNATSCWICKYNWRCFLPVACCCRSPDLSAYENAGFLEIATAAFATDVVKKGFKKNLQSSDLGKLSKTLQAEFNLKRFMRFYEEEKAKTGTRDVALGKIFWRTIRTKFVLAVVALLSYLTAEFVMAAVVLQNILLYVENPSGSVMDGLIWVLLLPVLLLCRALLVSSSFLIMLRSGIAARALALSLIYRKLSRLKTVGNKSIGELVNLCANDAQRIFECCQFCIFVISAPFLTILMSVYMYLKFGPSSLIGLAVMILFLPIQALLGKLIGKIRAKVIIITDKRVKMINEVITCIKLIKMYAWEKSFSKVIAELRSKEKNLLVGLLVIQAINMSMGLLLTSIAPVATFAAHIAFGNDLSVSEAFTVIAMFNIYPPTIALLPMAVRGISESLNAMKRLKNLMGLEEFVPYTNEPNDSGIALSMEKCDFAGAVRILIQYEAKVDAKDNDGWTPLCYAAKNGFWKSLKILLENGAEVDTKEKNNNTPLLLAAAHGHLECVKILLEKDADISWQNSDKKNCLDLAIANFHQEICEVLIKNSRWQEVLDKVDDDGTTQMRKLIVFIPEVAELVLDKCITEMNPTEHEDYAITYNFKYIDRIDRYPTEKQNDLAFEPVTMAEYDREKLLSHPVTKKIMALKWERLGRSVYYITLLLYSLFVACVTSVVVFERENDRNLQLKKIKSPEYKPNTPPSVVFTRVIPALTLLFCIVNILKEIVQIIIQRKRYFKQINNYMEWTLYSSTFVFMLDFLAGKDSITFVQKWNAGTISVFLTWINLLLFLTRFPFFDIYVEMFVQVLTSVLRVLLVFFIFMVAFSLSFYSLLRELKTFSTVGKSLMKVIVMTSGELEYDTALTENVNTNATSGLQNVPMEWATYTVYTIFLILMPIILMNLLVGLAVGDIEAVRKTASIHILKKQVDILCDMNRKYPTFVLKYAYEEKITDHPNHMHWFKKLRSHFGHDFQEDQAKQQSRDDKLNLKIEEILVELRKQKMILKSLKKGSKGQNNIPDEEN